LSGAAVSLKPEQLNSIPLAATDLTTETNTANKLRLNYMTEYISRSNWRTAECFRCKSTRSRVAGRVGGGRPGRFEELVTAPCNTRTSTPVQSYG